MAHQDLDPYPDKIIRVDVGYQGNSRVFRYETLQPARDLFDLWLAVGATVGWTEYIPEYGPWREV